MVLRKQTNIELQNDTFDQLDSVKSKTKRDEKEDVVDREETE